MTAAMLPDPAGVPVDDDLLRRAYELMVFTRHLDTQSVAWRRQGLLPAYPPLRGQAAAQVGSVLGVELGGDFLAEAGIIGTVPTEGPAKRRVRLAPPD